MTLTEAELAAMAAVRIGSVLGGKYRLVHVLGVGGMGTVYAAVHRNGARVAVKVLHPLHAGSGEMRRRFVREGLLSNRIEHPGVVRILDDDLDEDGSAYLVMELLTGSTCRELAAQHEGRLGLGATLFVAHEVLRVLAVAHREDVIHRDVKPSNVFITTRGEVKLLDFGIARLREAGAPVGVRTETGAVLGTPGFMCPEQVLGRTSELDARSDLWGVGAMMFNLLSGEPVHVGETAQEVNVYTATQPVRPLASVVGVPAAVAAIVDRALALAPADRWQHASEMAEAIERAHAAHEGTAIGDVRIEGVAASPPGLGAVTIDPLAPGPASLGRRQRASTIALEAPAPSPAGPPAPRRQLGVASLAKVALSLAGLIVASWWIRHGRASAPPPRAVSAPAEPAACSKAACPIDASCQGGRCCAKVAATGTPPTNTTSIVSWALAAPATEVVATTTILAAGPSHKIAMGLGSLSGTIDGQGFTYVLQTDVFNRRGTFGRGALFVRMTRGDVSEVRPTGLGEAAGPWTDGPYGDQVSLRHSYDWQAGTYQLRIRRREPGRHPRRGVAGDWFEISLDDPQRGEVSVLGTVWFARAKPDVPATIEPTMLTYLQFYLHFSEAPKKDDDEAEVWATYATLPAWTVATMLSSDGLPAQSATSRYQMDGAELATSDVWYDAVADRVVSSAGGATARCHPPQRLFAR